MSPRVRISRVAVGTIALRSCKRASRDRWIAGEKPTSQDKSRRGSRIASGLTTRKVARQVNTSAFRDLGLRFWEEHVLTAQ